jgi:capsular exopolysaccharide synthesis family protein
MSSVLRRHLWLIGSFVVLSVAVAGWLSSRAEPVHRAEAVIRIATTEAPVATGVDPLLSELVVLTGRTVLGHAVDREGLRLFSRATGAPAGFVEETVVSLDPPRAATITLEFGEQGVVYGPASDRRTAAYGDPVLLEGATFVVPAAVAQSAALAVVPRDRAVDYLLDGLTTIPDSSTGLVRVPLTVTEPRVAVRALNAIVEMYRAVSAESAREDIRRRRAFLEQELRAVDSLLVVARGEADVVQAREEEALQRARQQADLVVYQGVLDRVVQLRRSGLAVDPSSLMSLPGIAADPAVRRLYTRLVAYRQERERLLTGPEPRALQHPDVQRLNSLMASTEESLVEAARRRLGALLAQAAPPVPSAVPESLPGAELAAGPPGAALHLPRSLEGLEETAERRREEYREARLEEASETGPVEIVQPATSAAPVAARTWWTLLLGLTVGLALGGVAAAVRELLAPRPRRRPTARAGVRVPAAVKPAAGADAGAESTGDAVAKPPAGGAAGEPAAAVPNLGVIPEVTPSLAEPWPNGDFRPGPQQVAGLEAYRALRKTLVASRWGLKTLVVTSAHPGEGKTTTSTNLAATYARQGRKVVLVECDLRRPSLGRYFGISKDEDLMDVLFHDQDWRRAIQLTRMPGLYVLLGEKTFPRAGESLGGDEMKRLLAELSAEYDLVILDTSPLLVAADAVALGPIVDGVVLVVRTARTDPVTVEAIVRQLREGGAHVLGTILNDPEAAAGAPG